MFIQQEVLRFEIPENDLLRVQVVECKSGPSHVESSAVLSSPHVFLVVSRVQLAAECQLQEQVQGLVAIVCLVQPDNETGVAHQLDILLAHDTGLHARLDNVSLAQGLQRIHLARLHVLHHLHRAEAPAAQQAQPLQLLPLDVAEALLAAGRAGPDLLHVARAVLASLLELLQGPQEHVEGRFVHDQGGGAIGRDVDGRRAGLALQQGQLAEALRCLELGHLRSVLHDIDGAFNQDVEVLSLLTLLEDLLILAEVHLNERLGERSLLIVIERIQELDLVQVLDVLLRLLHRRCRQDLLELGPVDDADHCGGLRDDGRGSRGQVHQRQLAKALALLQHAHAGGRGGVGALALAVLGDHDLKLTTHDSVEVVSVQVALLDHLCALLNILLPHQIDHRLALCIVQGGDGRQIVVFFQG
mmetsp:Transcript_166138/g.403665  ORF Transcript_166138/g.403665 Transcript_166138/m.403665 type:complete len:415 (+) Transcript_166138:630-1874(+)